LGVVFVPIVTTFSAIAIAVLLLYDIDRARHQKNVAKLESADEAASDATARAVS
jgi:Na+/melibiose symporter-like transporter